MSRALLVLKIMQHASRVELDIEAVEAEMEAEKQAVILWSVATYGSEVDTTPHMAVLRDQLEMLKEEREFCHLGVNV